MINLSKTRLMTKCAVYEKGKGAEDIGMSGYYKSDYVRMNIAKTIFSVTIGYFFLCVLYFLYKFNDYVETAFELDYKSMAKKMLAVYLVIIAVYIALTWMVSSLKYVRSRTRLNNYYKMLSRIKRLNAEGERTKDLKE